MEGQVNRSHSAFLLAGYGLIPLALGIVLPSFGVDANVVLGALGLVAVFVAILQARRGVDGPSTLFRWIIGLSLIAYVFRLIEPWSSEFRWLAWISSAAELAGPTGYFLLARSGIAIARALRDPSLERSWQGCAWIGLPLLLLPSLFLFAWWAVSGFPDALTFESHNLFAIMGGTLVLSLPAVLLLHALLATQKAVTAASERPVRLPLRALAHSWTAAAIVLLFLAPSLVLVPHAIHFAVTPSFDEFVTENRSAFSLDLPAGVRMLERHSGLAYASDGWIDIDMEEQEKKAERLGYDFSLELTRPDTTLLDATHSLQIKVEPATYEDFLELRVLSKIEAIDPRFRLAMTALLDHTYGSGEGEEAAVPTLEFMLVVALLAGAGDTTVETIFVDGIESRPLVAAGIGTGSLSYVWQARGKFELVPFCRKEGCLAPRVRYQREQRFDIGTEEYSYAMKSALTMKRETRGPGVQSDFQLESDIDEKSKNTSWNDVPW